MKIPGKDRQSIQSRRPAAPRAVLSLRAILSRSRGSNRGAGLVELMVASLLLCIGLMGLVNTWAFSFTVTTITDDRGIAYNLGRQAVERVKMSGFSTTSEGSSTLYYDGNQVVQNAASTARYSVTTDVASDKMSSGTTDTAGGVPANDSLRTVTVTVKTVSPVQTLFTTQTYLVRAGI